MRNIRSIAFFGAGNVACQMASRFLEQGLAVTTLVHRDSNRAPDREDLKMMASVDPHDIYRSDPDLIIIAVNDSSIGQIADFLRETENEIPVVHTSGGQSSYILVDVAPTFGTFYPLQTITSGQSVDWANVPICVESEDAELASALQELASRISDSVHTIDNIDRQWLHVAAVIQNNFVNHLLARTTDILQHRSCTT